MTLAGLFDEGLAVSGAVSGGGRLSSNSAALARKPWKVLKSLLFLLAVMGAMILHDEGGKGRNRGSILKGSSAHPHPCCPWREPWNVSAWEGVREFLFKESPAHPNALLPMA